MRTPRVDAALYPTLYDSSGKVFQLQKLSHRHLAIMDYMLAYPTKQMGQIADHFRVTPAWLSTVRQSDLFKQRFNDRRRLIEDDQHRKMNDKLLGLANDGLDTLVNIVKDKEQDGRLKLDATKIALESLGFLGKNRIADVNTPPAEAKSSQLTVHISFDAFAAAREAALSGHSAQPVIEHKGNDDD